MNLKHKRQLLVDHNHGLLQLSLCLLQLNMFKRVTPATRNVTNQSTVDSLMEGYDQCTRLGPTYRARKHGFNNSINALRSEASHIVTIEQAVSIHNINAYFGPYIVSAAAGDVPLDLTELRTTN